VTGTLAIHRTSAVRLRPNCAVTIYRRNVRDLILAMDHSNLRNLKALQPSTGKAELDLFLRRYAGLVDEVPDPYYDGDQGFEQVLDLIESACDQLVIEVKGRL
jgi:protein-tyrosine phosphatase